MGWPKGKKRGPMSAATKAKIAASRRASGDAHNLIKQTGSREAAIKFATNRIAQIDKRLAELNGKKISK